MFINTKKDNQFIVCLFDLKENIFWFCLAFCVNSETFFDIER